MLGAPGVQARTFHSAALRQVRYFWPRVYGGEPPQLIESKLGLVAGAARRNRVETDQARLRDVASEIEWSKVSNVRPDDYVARRAGARPRGQRARRTRRSRTCSPATRTSSASRGAWTWRTSCSAAPRSWPRTSGSPPRCAGSTSGSSSTSSRTSSPIQAALLDLWLGGRDEICVVGDPAQTIYSFAGARASYLTEFPRTHEGTTSVSPGPQLPLHAAGDRGRQQAARRHQVGGRAAARPARGRARRDLARAARRGGRGRRRRARGHPPPPRRRAAARDGGAVPDQRAVRGVRGGADRRPASPTSSAARPASSTGPRCARRPR